CVASHLSPTPRTRDTLPLFPYTTLFRSLDEHRLVLADDRRGQLVVVVSPSVGNACMQLRHPGGSFLPVVGALLLTGQSLLCLAKSTFRLAEELWGSDLLPVGENGEVGKPEVYPNLVRRLRERLVVDFDDERGEVPPGRVLGHGHA